MQTHLPARSLPLARGIKCPARAVLQRKCACVGSSGSHGECEECRKKGATLQRSASGHAEPRGVPAIVHQTLRSPGQPLDHTTRSRMESGLGYDFSKIRVHTDDQAASSAQAVWAKAYTVGHNVVFGRNEYDPASDRGTRLLAHELAHVVQQESTAGTAAPATSSLEIGKHDDPAEREADQEAERLMGQDSHPRVTPALRQTQTSLRRQPKDPDEEPKKEPDPLIPLPHPFDKLDIKPILPGLGAPSLEDVHKGYETIFGDKSKPRKITCDAPDWRLLKSGYCCPKFSVDPKLCCPPGRLTNLGRCCPPDQFAQGIECIKGLQGPIAGVKPFPAGPAGGPGSQPQTGGDVAKPSYKVKLPPLTPPLTVDLVVHFQKSQPPAVVADEAAFRASLVPGGDASFDSIVAWLKRDSTFAVQLTGKASSEGAAEFNQKLGEYRARSMANALILKGISPGRIMDPPGVAEPCGAVAGGIHNCGAAGAASPKDEKDRQVRARLFIPPQATR